MGRLKIGAYSPYLDTASGGEKYILTIAETLSQDSEVDVFLDQHLDSIGGEKIRDINEKRHNIDLSRVRFIKAPIGKEGLFFNRLLFLRNYDAFFYNTDGSIFFSTAGKNFIHFQLPLKNINTGIWGKIKLATWTKAIYNSFFTKEHIESEWNIRGEVIYPPVDIKNFRVGKKKQQIMNVGRFVNGDTKKQSVMIEIFSKIIKEYGLKDWSLHLAGGMMDGNENFLKELKKKASGLNVFFHENIKLDELVKLYSESMVYWHAMGYDEDDPKNLEHFGITTVEAMASGCIPVVINKGGQKEIIKDGESGYLWNTIEECIAKTNMIIEDIKLRNIISTNATKRSKDFSKESFEKKIKNLIYEN